MTRTGATRSRIIGLAAAPSEPLRDAHSSHAQLEGGSVQARGRVGAGWRRLLWDARPKSIGWNPKQARMRRMSTDGSGGAGPYPRPVTPITPSFAASCDRRPALVDRPDPADLYAALDLGTNSCRMLIAQPKGNQLHVVDSFSKSVQLGQGLEASGRLGRASMARAVGRSRSARKSCRSTGWSGCAWSRRRPAGAPPTRRVHRLVKRDTGLDLEIIEPEEEARLAVVSCAPLVSTPDRTASGRRYRRRLDRACLDRPQPRARPERPKAIMRLHQGFDHEERPFPAPRSWTGSPSRSGWRRSRTCMRRGRRWRAFRADELVFRGTARRFLAL
jgi:hypothetical protein